MDAAQALATVDRLYRRLAGRRPDIEKQLKYFRGDHPLVFASAEWAKQHKAKYSGFSDNWCGVVGSAPGERTEVRGFRVADQQNSRLEEPERQLWRDWESNEGPAQSSQGFLMSTIARRSSVIVWGDDDDEPVMTWEDPAQVIVDYDVANPRRRRAALKAWVDGETEFATLYTPDALWKYKRSTNSVEVKDGRTASGLHVPTSFSSTTGGNDWEPRLDTGDDTWPLENPMDVVPVVEFPNRPMLNGSPLSDIAGTMAMQDAVNLLWAYLFTQADFAGMPARVVSGGDRPEVPILDKNGQIIGRKPMDLAELANDRLAWLPKDSKVDQWEAAKLDVFTGVINVAIRHIAAQTRTPIYLVHGELGNVNGETLTGLDAPLVSKVRESHKFYRSPVREVFALFALVRGNTDLAKKCRAGTVQWVNPEVRSDAHVSDAASKDREIGWPMRSILRTRYNLSPDEIDDVMSDIAEEQSNAYLDRLDEKDAAAAAAGVGV